MVPNYQDSIKKYIENITTPIFKSAFPQEAPSNSMTTTPATLKKVWRPNNYRREIKIKTVSNSTLHAIGGTMGIFPVEKYINPHTHILSIKDFKKNITIQVFKNTLIAIYKQPIINGKKQEYLIEANSIKEIQAIISKKVNEIKKELDSILINFSKRNKLNIPMARPKWTRYEDYHRLDDYIDRIPEGVVFHSDHIKKVYGKGIEFINRGLEDQPGIKLVNYITNRAIEDISPQIAQALNQTNLRIDEALNRTIAVLEARNKIDIEFMAHIKTHTAVMRKIEARLDGKQPIDKQNNKLKRWLK